MCGGTLYETRACGRFRKEHIVPVVGDMVELSENRDAVVEILPRKNVLIRPPVANVDQILVVASPVHPRVEPFMIDAFLLTAEFHGIDAMLCISKSDLAGEEECLRLRHIYERAGYKVVVTGIKSGVGTEELLPHLKDKVTAVAGNSGVGKSTLLNALGDFSLETGDVSEKLERGKHTTRHVELFPLSFGGFILDTPGFSRVQLPNVTADKLSSLYREIAAIDKPCRYTGCAHISEPDCAVKEACKDGKITKERYESYQYFYGKLKENKFWETEK